VYQAIDQGNPNNKVAIKVMRWQMSAAQLERQRNKIKALHEMVASRPGRTHIMESIRSCPSYIVYRWAGEEGSKLMPKLNFAEALGLLKQVTMALYALFRHPLTTFIHHDLKWQNVAVDDAEHGKCLQLIDLDDYTTRT